MAMVNRTGISSAFFFRCVLCTACSTGITANCIHITFFFFLAGFMVSGVRKVGGPQRP